MALRSIPSVIASDASDADVWSERALKLTFFGVMVIQIWNKWLKNSHKKYDVNFYKMTQIYFAKV